MARHVGRKIGDNYITLCNYHQFYSLIETYIDGLYKSTCYRGISSIMPIVQKEHMSIISTKICSENWVLGWPSATT